MKVNWDNRLRDGILYAIGSGVTLLLLFFFYQIHTIHSQVFFVILLFPWWFLTVQATKRLAPDFFGDLEYTVYKIKKEEDERKEMFKPGDAVGKKMTPAQISSKRQPTSSDFWRAQRAAQDSQSPGTQAPTSQPRIVPISYPMKQRSSQARPLGEQTPAGARGSDSERGVVDPDRGPAGDLDSRQPRD